MIAFVALCIVLIASLSGVNAGSTEVFVESDITVSARQGTKSPHADVVLEETADAVAGGQAHIHEVIALIYVDNLVSNGGVLCTRCGEVAFDSRGEQNSSTIFFFSFFSRRLSIAYGTRTFSFY
jgi:hypothetical protein